MTDDVTSVPSGVRVRRITVSTEVRRALRTRTVRTTLAAVVALPPIIAAAVALGASNAAVDARLIAGLAGTSGSNFTFLVLLITAQLFLAVVASVLTVEVISREFVWGHSSFLAVLPVPRARWLFGKFVAGFALTALSIVALAATSMIVGTAVFGFGPLTPVAGEAVLGGNAWVRVLFAVAYLVIYSAWIVALALLAAVLSRDNPVVAVGTTVTATLISHLLGGLPGLGSSRGLLPTRNYDAWIALSRGDDVDVTGVQWGVFVSLFFAIGFVLVALVVFSSRDIGRR